MALDQVYKIHWILVALDQDFKIRLVFKCFGIIVVNKIIMIIERENVYYG